MITLELIKQFCSTDESRPALSSPWLFEGDVVATDGRILIRLPPPKDLINQGEFRSRDLPEPPNIAVNPWGSSRSIDGDWIACPTELPEHLECEDCRGSGIFECDCPTCQQQHDCENCEGRGWTWVRMKIGGWTFNSWFIDLILKLPKPELCMGGEAEEPMRFRFEGGEGLLMKMRCK